MRWQVSVKCDVVKGQFNEAFHAFVFYEVFYVLATNGTDTYIHFMTFEEWEGAAKLVFRIRNADNFTPENKPHTWHKINHTWPYKPYKRDWRNLVIYGKR